MQPVNLSLYAPTLMKSTRAIGYSIEAAIADIIDNSIAAFQILEKIIEKLNNDEICNILLIFGAEKIVNNLRGGSKHVDITKENEQVLNLLYNFGLIYKFEVTSDNQHYKRIRFKEKNVK